MQRQLSPPKEMITITDAWIDQKRPRDPKGAEDFLEKYKDKIGRIMPKHHRKRAVMDQKATSVADIAAVLKIQEEEVQNGFANGKRGYLTPTARKRRRAARAKEEQVAAEQAARVAGLEQALSSEVVEYKVQETADTTGALEDQGVKILWRDLHDARFAEAWPERVRHGELELSRDHVMPGQKGVRSEVLAEGEFRERTEQQQQGEKN